MVKKKVQVDSSNSGIADSKSAISGVIDQINKSYGNISGLASNIRRLHTDRISTDIFMLDYALGGGVPLGHKIKLFGHASSGKTTTALRIIKNAQAAGLFCAYVDVEGELNVGWAKQLGVNVDDLLLISPPDAEKALDAMYDLAKSGIVDVICLDSIAALTPSVELEKSFAEWQQGLQARLIGKFMRKITSVQNDLANRGKKLTWLLINQLREKIGLIFGDPSVEAGGKSHLFASTVEVKMWGRKNDVDDIKKGGTGKTITVESNFKIEKNKTFSAGMGGNFLQVQSEMPNKKVGEILDEPVIRQHAIRFGLLEKDGRAYKIGDGSITTLEGVDEYLMQDKEAFQKLRKELLEYMLNL